MFCLRSGLVLLSLAAWLFVAVGLLGAFGVVVGVPLWFLFVGLVVAGLFPVFYSLWLYKRLEREGKLDQSEASAGQNVRC